MPTPEQARELVEHFGGQRPAARACGVSGSTVKGWLEPEKKREARRRRYAAKPEKERAARRRRYAANPAAELEANRRRRRELRDRGLCADCAEPRLSEWYCWKCLNKREEQRGLTI